MTCLVARIVLDGAIGCDWLEVYVAQVLVPKPRPSEGIIIDELSSNKRTAVKERIEPADATQRFVPQYSLQCSLIAKAFSRLKIMLRRAGERTLKASRF